MMKADRDEKAVTLRLKQVSQLRRLCLSLGKAGSADPSRIRWKRENQGGSNYREAQFLSSAKNPLKPL